MTNSPLPSLTCQGYNNCTTRALGRSAFPMMKTIISPVFVRGHLELSRGDYRRAERTEGHKPAQALEAL